ncbi:MAG TPA: histidinol dehydrogenase [Candidatus Dormibacteraeota bacterium]
MSAALRLLTGDELRELLRERAQAAPPADEAAAVRTIVEDVRLAGDTAVRRWTRELDGVDITATRVPREALEAAWEATPIPLRLALDAAAEWLRRFHEHQRDEAVRGSTSAWLRPEPLRRVGCYVPGGRAAYPSTVLHSVIPAQVAGVESIALASPPAADRSVHPLVAAAAHQLGVEEVHAVGGAQAVAAFAFGTQSIPRVDKIVGPGNVYVTLAKQMVFGPVGIDQIAGPTEILVIATTGAHAELVAQDLVSQLEHDPRAWALCLTDDSVLAERIADAFARVAAEAARAGIIAAAAGTHAGITVCDGLAEAVTFAEEFAPEHLSLQGDAAERLRDSIRNAGAIFCGTLSPVSMGDYVAGPNHTLPTGGAARHRGPLAVMDFTRWPSVVQLSAAEYEELAPIAERLAEAEGLAGHAAAIRARLRVAEAAP